MSLIHDKRQRLAHPELEELALMCDDQWAARNYLVWVFEFHIREPKVRTETLAKLKAIMVAASKERTPIHISLLTSELDALLPGTEKSHSRNFRHAIDRAGLDYDFSSRTDDFEAGDWESFVDYGHRITKKKRD